LWLRSPMIWMKFVGMLGVGRYETHLFGLSVFSRLVHFSGFLNVVWQSCHWILHRIHYGTNTSNLRIRRFDCFSHCPLFSQVGRIQKGWRDLFANSEDATRAAEQLLGKVNHVPPILTAT
jgi:hypothetical protein